MRDPLAHQKSVAGAPGVPEYYRLMAYGQILIYEMSEIQQRMAGVPYARGRRPAEARDELSIKLTERWKVLVPKLEEIEKAMKEIEEEEKTKDEPEQSPTTQA
jgi:hypothetical protein